MESIIKKAFAQVALQDPFHQGLVEDKHMKELDVSSAKPREVYQTKRQLNSFWNKLINKKPAERRMTKSASNKNFNPEQQEDPDKIFRTYPSFDPVFMKV